MLVKVDVPKEDAAKLKAIAAARLVVRVTFKSAHGKKFVWSETIG